MISKTSGNRNTNAGKCLIKTDLSIKLVLMESHFGNGRLQGGKAIAETETYNLIDLWAMEVQLPAPWRSSVACWSHNFRQPPSGRVDKPRCCQLRSRQTPPPPLLPLPSLFPTTEPICVKNFSPSESLCLAVAGN